MHQWFWNVVGTDGTAPEVQVPGYSVGGKTGTAYKATAHGYDRSKYRASFVGIAPMSNPRIIVAVSVDDPRGGKHFGGQVSGPVFSSIAGEILRAMNVAPDNQVKQTVATATVREASAPVKQAAMIRADAGGSAAAVPLAPLTPSAHFVRVSMHSGNRVGEVVP